MLRRLVLAAFTLLSLLAIGASPAFASSHREAPLITGDPEADLNDVYAFRDFAHPGKVNFIVTAYPLEEPGDAPNYYTFGKNVRYNLNIDRNGDARPDLTYRFTFSTHVRNGDVFVYNLPGNPVTSLNDDGLNVYQTYDVTKVRYAADGSISSRCGSPTTCGWYPTTSAPRRCRTSSRWWMLVSSRSVPATACGQARPTTRSSSTWARSETASRFATPASTRWAGSTPRRSRCRCRSRP